VIEGNVFSYSMWIDALIMCGHCVLYGCELCDFVQIAGGRGLHDKNCVGTVWWRNCRLCTNPRNENNGRNQLHQTQTSVLLLCANIDVKMSESDWGVLGAVPSATVSERHSKCIIAL